MDDALGAFMAMAGLFGGVSLLIWTSGKARIERLKAERQSWQQPAAPQQDAVLAELKALTQQVAQMQSTGHQFDLSFDAALNRMEERVGRLETKAAAATSLPPMTQTQRNGNAP